MLTEIAPLIDCDCQGDPGGLRHEGQEFADALASSSSAMRRSAS